MTKTLDQEATQLLFLGPTEGQGYEVVNTAAQVDNDQWGAGTVTLGQLWKAPFSDISPKNPGAEEAPLHSPIHKLALVSFHLLS